MKNENGFSSELSYILEKLIVLHRSLLDLLQEEYEQMTFVDAKSLLETAHSKEVLLFEIWNLEQLRIKTSERIALEQGLVPSKITLLNLTKNLPQQEQEKLKTQRTILNQLLKQAKERNARNQFFVESSLVRLDQMKKNVLGMGNNSNENYSHSGIRQPIHEQGGRLLSTEA